MQQNTRTSVCKHKEEAGIHVNGIDLHQAAKTVIISDLLVKIT
jgi:hypothetical protein